MVNPFKLEADTELVVLVEIMTKKYGVEWVAWETETLRSEILKDFTDVSELAFQKVCAGQLALAHDMCWKEWEVFEKVCAACNHMFPVFSFTQPPEPEDLVIAMATLNHIANNEYSEEVKKYMVAACLNDGLLYLDGPLSICSDYVDDYMNKQGFFIDRLEIEKSLKTAPHSSANTYAEIQANRVINCRNALKDFYKELDKERKVYAHLLR